MFEFKLKLLYFGGNTALRLAELQAYLLRTVGNRQATSSTGRRPHLCLKMTSEFCQLRLMLTVAELMGRQLRLMLHQLSLRAASSASCSSS